MLKQYELKMPSAVYSGESALEHIKGICEGRYKKALIFTDKGIMNAGLIEKPLKYFEEAGVEYHILSDLPAEPSCDQAQAVIDESEAFGPDLIVAIGGGSVMDIAKLASMLIGGELKVRDLLESPKLAKKKVASMMIPTTAGTGSEATPNSIVAVPEKELKVGIVNDEMIADHVILDGEMIKKLPRKIAASTGIDALCHAIECYTSKKANPFSDTFAMEALELIINNIEKSCDDPEAIEAKNAMLIAAFYAGVAITASGTTAVHALSYPLGGKYHIAHGVSNAMLLMPVMRFNEPCCRERFCRVYDRVCGEKPGLSDEEKSAWVMDTMDRIVKHLDIPTDLKEFGVGKEDLDELAAAGMDVQRLLVNNMREVTLSDAKNIYLEIM